MSNSKQDPFNQATGLFRMGTGDPTAEFRKGQWEATGHWIWSSQSRCLDWILPCNAVTSEPTNLTRLTKILKLAIRGVDASETDIQQQEVKI